MITKNKGYFPNENVLDDNAVLDSSTITKQFFDTKMDPRKLIKKFLDHFSNQGIKIIFYLSPMTEGDLAYNFFTDKYKGLACNEIKRYPNNFFADYVHMSINGAKENSYQLAKFIKEYAF